MSSTNRGSDRHISDYYVTPQYEIKKFWNKFTEIHGDMKGSVILDPCAGGDEKHEMSYPVVLEKHSPSYEITTFDIRDDSLAQHKGIDYLDTNIDDYFFESPDIIISNPPFAWALDFVQKALDDVEEGGYVIMLLRLNFLGSGARNKWLRENMPYEIYVHGKRMSFTENGKTDSIEYAHFVWKKGYKGVTNLHLLEFK